MHSYSCGFDGRGNVPVRANVEDKEKKEEQERTMAKDIIRALEGGGTIGHYEIIFLTKMLRYLILVRKITDEDGSVLITKERISKLARRIHDGHAEYYFEGLKAGSLPYDPDQTFEWMKISNRRGNKNIGPLKMKEARKYLQQQRIRVAIEMRDKAEAAAMSKSEPRIVNEKLAKLLDYMSRNHISFAGIGRTQGQIMGLSKRI
jgi:hypothetical protein